MNRRRRFKAKRRRRARAIARPRCSSCGGLVTQKLPWHPIDCRRHDIPF